MNIRLSGQWSLSDEHATSSYGQPVLVNNLNEAFGPGDVVKMFPSWIPQRGADAVRRFATITHLTKPQRKAAEAFCGGRLP